MGENIVFLFLIGSYPFVKIVTTFDEIPCSYAKNDSCFLRINRRTQDIIGGNQAYGRNFK